MTNTKSASISMLGRRYSINVFGNTKARAAWIIFYPLQRQSHLNKMLCHEKAGESKPFIVFDLDDTLIKTVSGKTHPINGEDWQPWHPSVEPKLRELAADHSIVVVSNQGGLRFKPFIRKKIRDVFAWLCGLGFDRVIVFAIGEYNVYRKPFTTIMEWNVLPHFPPQEIIQIVGDAAGRTDDHSDSDRVFALNTAMLLKQLGSPSKVRFSTPEEYFLREPLQPRQWCKPRPCCFTMESDHYRYYQARLEADELLSKGKPPDVCEFPASKIYPTRLELKKLEEPEPGTKARMFWRQRD